MAAPLPRITERSPVAALELTSSPPVVALSDELVPMDNVGVNTCTVEPVAETLLDTVLVPAMPLLMLSSAPELTVPVRLTSPKPAPELFVRVTAPLPVTLLAVRLPLLFTVKFVVPATDVSEMFVATRLPLPAESTMLPTLVVAFEAVNPPPLALRVNVPAAVMLSAVREPTVVVVVNAAPLPVTVPAICPVMIADTLPAPPLKLTWSAALRLPEPVMVIAPEVAGLNLISLVAPNALMFDPAPRMTVSAAGASRITLPAEACNKAPALLLTLAALSWRLPVVAVTVPLLSTVPVLKVTPVLPVTDTPAITKMD